ncbi:MAG: hypothetical protein IT317_17070 [Anaerolineales bacterium]|nr:hypothetical protein [Anaerolineales bacterium]
MSSDPRLMSSLAAPAAPRPAPPAAPTAASSAQSTSAPAAAAPRAAPAAQPAPAAARVRSLRAAAIRARAWQTVWSLALRYPGLEVFEGLAANPSGSLERALRWCLAGAALGFGPPALFSFVRGLVPLPTILFSYGALVVLLVAAFALAVAAACAAAAHLAAHGFRLRPHLLERQPAPAGGAGLFQREVYARLLFACAAFAAPLSLALGGALLLPGLARVVAVLGLAAASVALGGLAVRAACRVSARWAAVAALAGFAAALLPLAVIAGAWWGLTS